MIVAIDGPAGSGKSTVARAMAAREGLTYLDTGAMYRAVTDAALTRGIDVADAQAVSELAHAIDIVLDNGADGPTVTMTVQNILDQLCPGLLALGLTLLMVRLLNKKINPVWLIFALFALGIIGNALGFLS